LAAVRKNHLRKKFGFSFQLPSLGGNLAQPFDADAKWLYSSKSLGGKHG
jgi:hypothetical protein